MCLRCIPACMAVMGRWVVIDNGVCVCTSDLVCVCVHANVCVLSSPPNLINSEVIAAPPQQI